MYPRVKVREQEDDQDQYDFEMRSLQSLKGLQLFSLDDLSSPDDSPTSVVRVPRLSSSNPATPSISTLKGKSRDRRQSDSENNGTNIRASPVPRPRAVLSSPDNDGIITCKNKRREALLSGSKNNGLCQNRHSQCKKVIPVAANLNVSAKARREPRQVTDSAVNVQIHRRAITPDPSKRVDKPRLVQSKQAIT